MLERNLMRLYNNYHHPHRQLQQQEKQQEPPTPTTITTTNTPWYGSPMQVYIAAVTTILLATMWNKK